MSDVEPPPPPPPQPLNTIAATSATIAPRHPLFAISIFALLITLSDLLLAGENYTGHANIAPTERKGIYSCNLPLLMNKKNRGNFQRSSLAFF